jgi:hypothetical protein
MHALVIGRIGEAIAHPASFSRSGNLKRQTWCHFWRHQQLYGSMVCTVVAACDYGLILGLRDRWISDTQNRKL